MEHDAARLVNRATLLRAANGSHGRRAQTCGLALFLARPIGRPGEDPLLILEASAD